MEEKIFAIMQWIFFCYNFPEPKRLCQEIWGGNGLAKHIYHKLVGYQMNFNKLFCELDSENRRLLLEWVINNYHGIDNMRK